MYDSCEQWAAQGKCHTNPELMKRHCEKDCNVCAPTTNEGKTYLFNTIKIENKSPVTRTKVCASNCAHPCKQNMYKIGKIAMFSLLIDIFKYVRLIKNPQIFRRIPKPMNPIPCLILFCLMFFS